MATLCLLHGKVKVKTAGCNKEEVWLSSESIAFPVLPLFNAVEPWHQTSKVHMIGQIMAQFSKSHVVLLAAVAAHSKMKLLASNYIIIIS